MAAWSVYMDSGRELRRYRSKAAAVNAVRSPRTFLYGLRARKTFHRNRQPIIYGKRRTREAAVQRQSPK